MLEWNYVSWRSLYTTVSYKAAHTGPSMSLSCLCLTKHSSSKSTKPNVSLGNSRGNQVQSIQFHTFTILKRWNKVSRHKIMTSSLEYYIQFVNCIHGQNLTLGHIVWLLHIKNIGRWGNKRAVLHVKVVWDAFCAYIIKISHIFETTLFLLSFMCKLIHTYRHTHTHEHLCIL